MDKKVTSIEQLKEYSAGQLVELPPFADGQPFVARIKRPSMLALVKSGKIPNSLLKTANKLFLEKGMDDENVEIMPQMFDVFDILAGACLVEPTFQQIKEAGVELTDDQMLFLFSYTQQGVMALERFRQIQENNKRTSNEQKVRKTSKRAVESK